MYLVIGHILNVLVYELMIVEGYIYTLPKGSVTRDFEIIYFS